MFMNEDTNEGRQGATRRAALRGLRLAAGGVALGGGLATGLGTSPAAAAPRRGTVTYVLVHGTHSAGAFWLPIARELTLRGHRVAMVDQPLHGAEAFVAESYQRQDLAAMAVEPSPLKGLGLEEYEARVTGVVRRAARNGPVVLVGHSLGGVSVSRVGDAVPHLLHHICYMAAFCPSRAMPTADACTAAPENANAVSPVELTVGDPDRLGVLRLNFRTGVGSELALLKEMICADYPDADFRRVLAGMQTDEPVTAYAGRAVGRAGTWGRIPRTYLRFGKDRTIATALQDRMVAEADAATPGNRFRVRDFPEASHIGPLDPTPVADALHALAG
ncbi:alpha/beta hydrolase [Streptomyces sp. 796.1]|uniref:alpha/beta hydrolase n=1 Tax=Streptomyces sp. 796.1 TaxID=3163029 RepID=UPI0039C97519